jgi:transcriptional antiterminator NusG
MGEIYTIRTTSGRENIVIDMIYTNIRTNNLNVKSILHPGELKGYIFIEAPMDEVKKAIRGVMHVKGVIEKPISLSDIQHFFETRKAKVVVSKSDIVEIIGGPFKGEKGKIQRIDKVKDEVTVELLEASIPIPVTISTELVRLVKRGKGEVTEGEEKK